MAQNKVNSSEIHEGMRYTAPLFFADGKNMFLAEGKPVKAYHMQALAKWPIQYLLTSGIPMTEAEISEKLRQEEAASKKVAVVEKNVTNGVSHAKVEKVDIVHPVEEFDDIEDLEMLDDVEDLEAID